MKPLRFLAKHADARAIAEGIFNDEADGIAMLDMQGFVQKANKRFTGLTALGEGKSVFSDVRPEWAGRLGAALRAAQAASFSLTSQTEGRRRVLRMTLMPVPGRGALLRVSEQNS